MKRWTDRPRWGSWQWAGTLAVLALLAGCAAPRATSLSDELPFEEAVARASEGLVAQTQKLPSFLARVELIGRVESRLVKRPVIVDPMIDAASGQQTAATQLLERRVTERMSAKSESFEVLPFRQASLAQAQYLLVGTLTRQPRARGGGGGVLKINLALAELKTGNVVAQASAIARDEGLDHTPLKLFQDSPVLLKDRVIDGYVRTAATPPGQSGDRQYLERLAVAPVLNEAGSLYEAERFPESLSRYNEAAGMSGGEQLRTLNGIYLNHVRLGRLDEAERAFGRIVAHGLRAQKLDLKFLFNPGSTAFWPDTKVSGLYPMWLRQIAREAAGAGTCMQVVGHTSRTGSEQYNDTLSLQRAEAIVQRLTAESPALARRARAAGVGFRENIVGSGTDDIVDALDRRVEFRIAPCG